MIRLRPDKTSNLGFVQRAFVSYRAAYSLVEVALAIGLIAFALVGLSALLPAGLTTFHQAMDTSVGAQIAQRLTGELQETDYFTLLKSSDPDLSVYLGDDRQVGLLPRRFFDDQGNEVRVASAQNLTPKEQARILYEVVVRVSRAKITPGATSAGVTRLGSRNLAVLTIQVISNPSGKKIALTDDLLVNPADSRLSVQTFSSLVARNTSTSTP